MVLQNHAVATGRKGFSDPTSQLITARQSIRGEPDSSAHGMCLMEETRIGSTAANAEGDQCDGMSVNDGADICTRLIDGLMKREFG